MERNPYAPPVSVVADPAEARGQRPKEVTRAIQVLWISLIVGAVSSILFLGLNSSGGEQLILLIGTGIALGFRAWIIAKIAKGRNWARILFLVFLILGLAFVVFSVLAMPVTQTMYRAQPMRGVLTLVNYALEIYTAYLLLTAPAREWFKQPAR
jgi:hypothetical protein